MPQNQSRDLRADALAIWQAAVEAVRSDRLVRDNVRVFDFLRGETVEVRYLTGGNSTIDTERHNTLSLGGTLVLAARGGLVLNAAWTRQRSNDAVSALPPVSAEVQAAFR